MEKDWQAKFEAGKQIARGKARRVFPFQAASIAIGIADNAAFFLFRMVLLSNAGEYWMVGALLLWVAVFLVGIVLLGTRSLWLLLGLPLVLLPFGLAVLGAGQI